MEVPFQRIKRARVGEAAAVVDSSSGGLSAFALRLSKELAERESNENVAFSPLSVYAALGLAAAGARGTTLDELLALLGAASRDELAGLMRAMADHALPAAAADGAADPVVTFACGVWCQKDLELKPAFRQAAAQSYKAEARAVDFVSKAEDAREEINGWVAEATRKLIPSVLPPRSVHADTRLVLASAVYFNGKWKKQDAFRKSRTKDRRFHRLDGTAVRVPFMSAEPQAEHFVACHDGFKVLKLPYMSAAAAARYSMCVFLPDARDGLRGLVDSMAAGGAGYLFGRLPRWREEVRKLRLPRFKLSFSCRMKDALTSLGLREAFGSGADFGDMVEEKKAKAAKEDSGGAGLWVEEVFHKAVVEVDEEGTVAAASTGLTMTLQCGRDPGPPVDFIADHPFAFFVVEEGSGAVLFTGHVLDPSNNSGE